MNGRSSFPLVSMGESPARKPRGRVGVGPWVRVAVGGATGYG